MLANPHVDGAIQIALDELARLIEQTAMLSGAQSERDRVHAEARYTRRISRRLLLLRGLRVNHGFVRPAWLTELK